MGKFKFDKTPLGITIISPNRNPLLNHQIITKIYNYSLFEENNI